MKPHIAVRDVTKNGNLSKIGNIIAGHSSGDSPRVVQSKQEIQSINSETFNVKLMRFHTRCRVATMV